MSARMPLRILLNSLGEAVAGLAMRALKTRSVTSKARKLRVKAAWLAPPMGPPMIMNRLVGAGLGS